MRHQQNERWPELEASTNPFAIVVMSLVRQLYEGGWQRQDVLELFRFIDWVLALPPRLANRFKVEVRKIETERHMRYVTSIERLSREEGLEQGFLQGEASLLKRLLKRRFERLPEWVEERLKRASRDELEGWCDQVFDAKALEDVFA